MDKITALLHEAKIEADENRSKDTRYFAASVVDCVESLRQELHDADESLKAVERALKDVDYRGSYADGVMYLKDQLASAQEELHFQACLTKYLMPYQERALKSEQQLAAAKFREESLINTAKVNREGLQEQLAAALAAWEAKDAALSGVCDSDEECEDSDGWVAAVISMEALHEAQEALAIKPDASILRQHDEALIERCAAVCEEYQGSAETCAAAIRELKSQL